MKISILIFQEVGERPTHAAVVALKYVVILHLEEITPCFILVLLTVATVGATKVIRSRFLGELI